MNIRITTIFVGALMLLMQSSCAGSGAAGEGRSLRSVVTARAEMAGKMESRSFSGVVREKAAVSVAFKTPGQIERICVREGQRVHRGQLLAQLDSKDYQLGVEAAQAQYDQLSGEIARMEQLLKTKDISANDYEKARYGLEQLRVQLQNSRNKVEYTTLTAPADGYIESVAFEPSEMVDAGTPVFRLIADGSRKVELNVPGSLYAQRDRIRDIKVIAGGESYDAELLSMIPKADATQLYRMQLSAEGAALTPGRNVEVLFSLEGADDADAAVTVPASAVINREGRCWVWVIEADSTVSLREVRLGRNPVGDRLMVESGLSAGEEIVRAGANVLTAGERVTVIPAASETNVGGLL